MIKFFRKIRYKLMNENKTGSSAETSVKAGKYLKYAIGEIILVIAGILIALSINNRNEVKKFNKQVMNQLILLSKEIDYDISEYNYIIEDEPHYINYLKKLSQGEYQDLDLNRFYKVVAANSSGINFGDTYKTLKENGGLNTINNLELREEIQTYHNYNRESYAGMNNYHTSFVINYIEPKVLELMEYDSNNQLVKENTIKIIKGKTLNNVINQQLKISQNILGIVERNLEEAIELKALLDNYIEEHKD